MSLSHKNRFFFLFCFISPLYFAQSPSETARTKYFSGEITILSPENNTLQSQDSLTQYQIFPKINKVVLLKKVFQSRTLVQEYTIEIKIQSGPVPISEKHPVLKKWGVVVGNGFSFSENTQFLKGQGILGGDLWNWTCGSYEYTLVNGKRVEGTLSIKAEELFWSETLLNEQNQPEQKRTEKQNILTSENYEILLSTLSESTSP
ncbi:MAG: hypothetical protein AABZ60_03690, partial [Planctomycetota bacterium]